MGTQVLSGGILPGFPQALSDGRTQLGNLWRNVLQAEAPPYHIPFPACSSGGWAEHLTGVQRRQPPPLPGYHKCCLLQGVCIC